MGGVGEALYFYIYCSNESKLDVFFDNLQVVHTRGALISESHYGAWGNVLKGISSEAALKLENKYKYNGKEEQNKEFSDGSGLDWYDYKNRFYDNQIGRFFCQDRIADEYVYYSPYQFAGNEVPNAIDLDGLEPLRPNEVKRNQIALIISVHGQENSDPEKGKTQTKNNQYAREISEGLGTLSKLDTEKSNVQVVQFSSGDDSGEQFIKDDIRETILNFQKVNPNGLIMGAGHSRGADNLIEFAKENRDIGFRNMFIIDVSDGTGDTDTKSPSNIGRIDNYYVPNTSFFTPGGQIMEREKKNSTTIITNTPIENTSHTRIDNLIGPLLTNILSKFFNITIN